MDQLNTMDDELLDRWLHAGDDADPRRKAIHHVAERIRRVSDALVTLLPEEADADALEAVAEELSHVEEHLWALPHLRETHGTPAAAPAPASLLSERSPISGRMNPVAAPLNLRYRHERTTATTTYTESHEGPEGGVHGGVVAGAFDELLGVAQMASGAAGYTVELTIRYKKITPLHKEIRYEAWVEGRHGRVIEVAAHSLDGDTVLAEAHGRFLAMQHLPVPSQAEPLPGSDA